MLTWNRILAACLSGMALAVISAPTNAAWLHWVSFVPLLWALRDDDNVGNVALGYLAGYVGVFSCYFWVGETVTRFSNLPSFIALMIVHLYALLHAVNYAIVFGLVRPLRRHTGWLWIFLLPALQVSSEYLLPALFPYNQGVSQYRVASVWQLTSVTGVYGISYLVFLTNSVVVEFLFRRSERRPMPWVPFAATLAIFSANVAFGSWRYQRVEHLLEEAPVVRVAMMQQDVSMEVRLSHSAKEAVESWFDMSLRLLPEGSSPYNPDEPPLLEALQKLVALGKYEILIGGGTREVSLHPITGLPTYTFYNSCYLMDRTGAIKGRYDKMIPLPFGEYIPLSNVFPFLKHIVQGPGDFRAGTEATIFQADGYSFAAPICYEAILDWMVRRLKNADLFINITNDAWFGDTAAPYQHAMLAAVRATEFGRPLLRIAYTGVNMLVEPHGRILYETKPFTEVVEVNEVRMAKVDTPYWRWGNWFALLCSILTAGGLLVVYRRARRVAP